MLWWGNVDHVVGNDAAAKDDGANDANDDANY